MYKEIQKDKLIDLLKEQDINYEIKVRNKKDKILKYHYSDIDEINIDDVKSVEFFIKTDYGLHLALVKVI